MTEQQAVTLLAATLCRKSATAGLLVSLRLGGDEQSLAKDKPEQNKPLWRAIHSNQPAMQHDP
jgi:hypothetical protein